MRSFVIALVIFCAAGIAAYASWVLTQPYDPLLEAVISSFALISLALLIALLGLLIAAKKTFPAPVRRAWLLMSLASLSNAIAEVIWLYYESVLKIDPFPSPADVFYLLFYPLMLAGILSLPFAPAKRDHRILLGLDMVIVMAVGAMFLWYFIPAPRQLEGASGLEGLVALSYPIADLFILAGLIALIQRDVENVGRWVLIFLAVSMLFTAFADILFAVLETYAVPYSMAPLNVLFMVSYWALLAAAGWQILFPASDDGGMETFHPLLRSTLLYVAPLLGMGLAFTSAVSSFGSDLRLYGTLVGAFGIAALVLLRQYVVLQDNQRLYREMEQIAVIDTLTGLYNRRYFNKVITREIRRVERYARPLSLLLIDVDNFKDFNDTYGHLRGDVLLEQIASTLASQVRTTDFLTRFGGDEFLVLLPETDIIEARAAAEKIQRAVATRFAGEKLGVSIGIAMFQPKMSVQSLLAEADRNLYQAKPDRA